MKRFLIVDGSNLLFQMFFGMPARIVNEKGKAIQGTLGFIGALLKIIRMVNPTHIAVIFDGEHQNSCAALNTDYKANRINYSEMPEAKNPFSQLEDVYSALDFMGISHTETTVCEADDIIAGYALTFGDEAEIIISSFDSDFFQLITNNVSVLRYRGKNTIICNPQYIKEKFGIAPEQYADFKALVGDNADNIKGADKIGIKTAAWMLNTFGTLDNILMNAQHITKPSIKESIIRNAEKLKINYKIIKLGNTVKLPFDFCKLEYEYTGITTNEILKGIGLK